MREPEIDDLELLERSCSTFVLRYLLHHPNRNKTEIMSTEGRNLTTKNRRIDELLAYNLLEVEEGYRRETIYSLSDPGGGSPSTWTRSARYWTRSGQA